MKKFLEVLMEKRVALPSEIIYIINNCKKITYYNSVEELADASTNGKENNSFDVKYNIEGKGDVVEAVVHRVRNGISANYPEAYMRRRDPETMSVGDNFPSDKVRFIDKYGYEFSKLKKETLDWLINQELSVFLYFAGREKIGVGGICIAPANAAFFAMGLAMMQEMISLEEINDEFAIESAVYVAPTFRHTHFEGKQVVVHNRLKNLHEVYSYNLYPGPSAKKGLYGVLLSRGEQEGWITTHCSTVQVISPYDNITTFMHEGASGGGKSEMLQNIVREPKGHILIGENILSGEEILITIPAFCSFNPVSDDMAMCHPSIQRDNKKLSLIDAENAWFIRVDNIKEYGSEPFLEKLTINPKKPLLFLNIETIPNGTALIWNHVEDEPGKRCPNPRVVVPRDIVPDVVKGEANVDVRSFGVRTPPCTKDKPDFGIIGLFHILPPALAWLWRLVSPRGYANPSIISTGGMGSEGVGSYWPFAVGEKVHHANLLLQQILDTPRVRYTLTPNQHIGVWKVGFKPQLLMREYLTRRGNAKLRPDQYQPARCPLLGYEMNYLSIEGTKIPSRFLKVHRQEEVGPEAYDAGAEILYNFFREQLPQFLTPQLSDLGRKIIEACLNGATLEEYNKIIPMDYEYSFVAPH